MLSLCCSVELLEKARERDFHIIFGSVVVSFETPYLEQSHLFVPFHVPSIQIVGDWDSLHAVRGQLLRGGGPSVTFHVDFTQKNIGNWTGLFFLFDVFVFLLFWSRVETDILLEIQSLVMCVCVNIQSRASHGLNSVRDVPMGLHHTSNQHQPTLRQQTGLSCEQDSNSKNGGVGTVSTFYTRNRFTNIQHMMMCHSVEHGVDLVVQPFSINLNRW